MEGADDLRGLWQQTSGGRVGHIERIEQCGNRFVVTAGGLIHDMTGDGKLSGSSNDVGRFPLGPLRLCLRTSATTEWHEKKLHFYAFGGPRVVSRYMEGDELVWIYPGFGVTRMKRICKLPSSSQFTREAADSNTESVERAVLACIKDGRESRAGPGSFRRGLLVGPNGQSRE
ncbi:MAG: hypothetical protein CM1200mP9_03760 [Gammaproteobacteria bacterium]|nr:MAG: hypothetical protein CM1200mP9_03760 [Gammaproteobacteria bacterium]